MRRRLPCPTPANVARADSSNATCALRTTVHPTVTLRRALMACRHVPSRCQSVRTGPAEKPTLSG
jgi:hypothetical protein